MTEYEWEPRRVPRTTRSEFLATYHPHLRDVTEFARLEHPRESVGWILREHARSKSRNLLSWKGRKASLRSRRRIG